MTESALAALVQSELFRDQMAALNQDQRDVIWRSLRRAREGKYTPGVENPWGGDYMLWPCGPGPQHQVLLRPLNSEEVAAITGQARAGFYLIEIRPSPI